MAVKSSPYDYPRESWKKYKVYYTSFGFDCGYFDIVEAPNKTWARRFKQGELNIGCNVIRIEELILN